MRRGACAFLLALLCSLTLCTFAAAAEVEIDLSPRAGSVEENFVLTVTVRGAASRKVEAPEFERSPVASLEGTGRAVRSSFINGAASFEVAFTYQVTPSANLRPGTYALPKGAITVDDKRIAIEPQKFVIVAGTPDTGERARARAAGVDFTHSVTSLEPYVGEQILYQAKIASGPSLGGGNLEDIELKGFWRESLGNDAEKKRNVGDIVLHTFGESLFPVHPGAVEIPGRGLRAKIRTRIPRRVSRSLFDELMLPGAGMFNLEEVRLVTSPIKLNVRELPELPAEMKDAPNGKNIPVGRIVMDSGVDRTSVHLGDSIAYTVTLEGNANLRPIELPPLQEKGAPAFKRYDDKPKIEVQTSSGGVTMKKTFSIALVPLRAGTFELPKYRLVAFDPGKNSYYWVESGGGKIEVLPATGSERLVVHGTAAGPALPGPTAAPFGVSDIRPQHEGSSLTAAPFVPSRGFRITVLVLAPLLAFVSLAFMRRRSTGVSAGSERDRYARQLREALDDLSSPPTSVLQALERFLSAHGISRKGSINPVEVGQIVDARSGNGEAARRATEGVKLLQRAVYGGESHPADLQRAREALASLLEVFNGR